MIKYCINVLYEALNSKLYELVFKMIPTECLSYLCLLFFLHLLLQRHLLTNLINIFKLLLCSKFSVKLCGPYLVVSMDRGMGLDHLFCWRSFVYPAIKRRSCNQSTNFNFMNKITPEFKKCIFHTFPSLPNSPV